ncbi:MAG: SprT family zinc-dependent metalloprotease [Bacteroidales bacterium]
MKEVQIPEIGKVRLNKNSKAKKNFNIRIGEDGTVEVRIPPGQSYRAACDMVVFIKEKILKSQQKIQNQKQHLRQNTTIFRENTDFYTRGYRVKIIRTNAETASCYIHPDNDHLFVVEIPQHQDIEAPGMQHFIREGIERIWRYEAYVHIPQRAQKLASEHNLSFSGTGITSARKRWGSCSSQNKLNFSLHLMMLPDELIDYVILHELAHTVHKNHSKAFYTLLNHLTGSKHETYKQKLKAYNIGVY